MGCGKSSVARALAARLECTAIDLDDLIVAREGCSIAEIFTTRGEEQFRRIEAEVLRAALQDTSTPRVIATGGGVVMRKKNRQTLRDAAERGVLVVYLQTAPDVLAKRIRRQPGLRPLIDGERVLDLADTSRRVEELLEIRAPLYKEVASLVLTTDEMRLGEIARHIIDCMIKEH